MTMTLYEALRSIGRLPSVPKVKLYTESYGGNLHETATSINKRGLAKYVLAMDSVSGYSTIIVYRMPAELVYKLREASISYVADPHHDDEEVTYVK